MDLFTLVARLTLDSSQFKSGIQQSQGLFSMLGSKVSAGTVAMGNLVSQGVSKAVGALVSFGKESVQTGISFESAMDQVAAISGTTGTKFDQLVDKAMEMGAVTKFSATESAEAFKYMAMAGWDADQMMAGIAGTMNLAAASGENLGTVSDIVTDVLTAMGKSAGDAGHFADVLAAASSSANTNVGMMGETFKYAAPIAGALGYSIEDLALATGLMANAGIKGGQAGTAMRAMLTRLAKPTKDSQKAMNKLGISLENSNGSMKSLREIMNDMRGSFEGLTESQQAEYAALLAGQEAMSGLLAIVNASDDDFNRLIENIDNSKDAAKTMAEIMMDNLGGSLEQFGGAMETLGLQIFDGIKGPLKDAVDFATEFVSSVTTAFKENGWAGAAEAASAQLTPIFEKTFGALETAAANAINVGANVLAGIYNGITGDSVNAENVKTYFSDLWSEIGGFSQKIVESGSSLLGDIYTGITGDSAGGEKIKETLRSVFEEPVATIDSLVAKGKTLFTDFFAGLSGDAEAGESLKQTFSDIFGSIRMFFDDATTHAGTLLSDIVAAFTGDEESAELIKETFADIFDKPLETFAAIIEKGSVLFSDIATALGADEESIELLKTTFSNFFKEPLSMIANMIEKGSSIITEITKAFTNPEKRAQLLTAIKGAFQEGVDFIASLPGKALEWGKSVIQNFVDGLVQKWNELKAKVRSIGSKIASALGMAGGGGEEGGGGRNFSVGLDYVPYDNYAANLHRGEAVLTRQEAEEWRAGNGGNGGRTINVYQTIYSEAKTAADLMREARWEQERGVLMAYV